jgi:hypothetical protein
MSNRKDGLDSINKRANRQQKSYIDSFTTNEINPLNNLTMRYTREIAYMAMESTHNTFFHMIETVKVRAQARNIVTGDISHYFKN